MEWVDVKDGLPKISYETKKSFCRVEVKRKECAERAILCSYRETFSCHLPEQGSRRRMWSMFYSPKGTIYNDVTHWRYPQSDKFSAY